MMLAKSWMRRLVAAAILSVSVVAVSVPGSSGPPVGASAGLGAGGEYHPVVPFRAFDSRKAALDDTTPKGIKPTSSATPQFKVPLAGKGPLPSDPSKILAVVANVTVVAPTQAGWLAVQPTGAAAGKSALVNFNAGATVPNVAFVGVGSDGSMTVKLASGRPGSAHVVVDVFGWISTSDVVERGARLVTSGPGRGVDTRKTGQTLGPRQSLAFQVRGANSIPNDPAVTAVVVNIAAIAGTAATHISATPSPIPAGQPSPTANINVVPGQIKTSMAIVPVGADGRIHLRNEAGRIDLAVDVFGYFIKRTDNSVSGRIVPLEAPFRGLDTRDAAFGNVPLGTGAAENWSFAQFAASVLDGSGIPLGAQSALIGNLTGTGLTRLNPQASVSTHLTAYPGGAKRPVVSNLNITEGEVVPNMSLLRYGSASGDDYVVQKFNALGSLHYVLDIYAVVLK
jgi:hypothetical protein